VDNGRIRALAELAVKVGANVGEGQYVLVTGLVEHAPLVAAIADVSYEVGARYVDAAFLD
jgi:leucyl aminopeptidase (aminopeptidase T)